MDDLEEVIEDKIILEKEPKTMTEELKSPIIENDEKENGVAIEVEPETMTEDLNLSTINKDEKENTASVENGADIVLKSNDEPPEYIVENILDKKIESGKSMYYIKWLGWPSYTNTWEPRKNLSGCDEKLKKFNKKWAAKQKRAAAAESQKQKELELGVQDQTQDQTHDVLKEQTI